MKLITILLLIFLSFQTWSQKYLYSAKRFSVGVFDDEDNIVWSKKKRVDIFVVFSTDSLIIDDSLVLDRKVLIYSNFYQELNLTEMLDFNTDEKGNYNMDFLGTNGLDQSLTFSWIYYKKKIWILIVYDGLIIEYQLRKKRSVCLKSKYRQVTLTSITKNSYNIS